MDFDVPSFSVIHELMLVIATYILMRAVDVLLFSEIRYGDHQVRAGIVRGVAILCLFVSGFYVVAALTMIMGGAS